MLVEAPGGEPDRLSLEALAIASGLAGALGGRRVEAVSSGPASAATAAAALGGVRGGHRARPSTTRGSTAYAPAAWAAVLGALIEARTARGRRSAPGSDRGAEVLAHVAARTGRPLAANVLAVEPGTAWRLTRQRWAGALLEDATLDGAGSAHDCRAARVPRRTDGRRPGARGRRRGRPRLRRATCRSGSSPARRPWRAPSRWATRRSS